MAFLAGSSIFGSGWKQKIYYKLMGVVTFDSFDMTEKKMQKYLRDIVKKDIKYMYGYANAIYHLALFAITHKINIKLNSVITTAENLTDVMRKTIEKSFGCKVFNQYGCNDAGLSAFECKEHNGLHLINTRAYIEVLDDGRLISTDTKNDVMPMLRYDSGDRVELSNKKCRCGRGFPLIKEIYGRSNDVVINPKTGAIIHSEFFNHLFREENKIQTFQIVLNDKYMKVLLKCEKILDTSLYEDRIKSKTGYRVDFMFNEKFVVSDNGKIKMIVK